jgi:hypothetical protein
MIRLRQIAMIAPDLDPVVEQLCEAFGLEVCFHDPGVGEFGLRNALLLVGDQFLEVLSPIEDDTTVGRLLEKRGGAGGYMAIYEVDDLDERLSHLATRDVRVIWAGNFPDIRGRHLHPRDVGGAIVSLDEPLPAGSWRWGGPDWPSMAASARDRTVDSISTVTVASEHPEASSQRWTDLGIAESVRFVSAGESGDGIDGVGLRAVDRSRVGERFDIGGVEFTLA